MRRHPDIDRPWTRCTIYILRDGCEHDAFVGVLRVIQAQLLKSGWFTPIAFVPVRVIQCPFQVLVAKNVAVAPSFFSAERAPRHRASMCILEIRHNICLRVLSQAKHRHAIVIVSPVLCVADVCCPLAVLQHVLDSCCVNDASDLVWLHPSPYIRPINPYPGIRHSISGTKISFLSCPRVTTIVGGR